jgi:hypothetical protein
MATGEIKITISGNVGEKDIEASRGGRSGVAPQLPETGEASAAGKNDLLKNAAFFAFASQIQSQMTKIGMRAINNIGNLTGDYILQDRVNTAINAVNFAAGFGVAAAAGPAGLAAWALATGVNEGLRQLEFSIQMEKARVNQSYLISKNGEVLRDNSRGGF